MATDPSSIAEKAAAALSLRLGAALPAPVGERPLGLAWRARRAGPADGAEDPTRALFVARPEAPAAERRRYVDAAARVAELPDAPRGVLKVHAVEGASEAFVTDLWTLGSAKDLGALGWPATRRVDFVRQMAEILETLHRAGIVHGCLCEENVLLDDDLQPVLAEAGGVSVHELSERGGDSASYVAFAAPEVLEGAQADARSDVYSLGRLLQHLVRSDDLPQAAEVIRRCVAPSPAGRYATAAALGQAIAGVVAAIGVETKPVASPVRLVTAAKPSADAPPVPFASAPPSSRRPPQPSWTGPVGGGLSVLAVVVASLGLGSTAAVQTALSALLVAGVALVAMAVRPTPRTSQALRAGFAVSAAALVAVADPLAYAYRAAAERAIHASPEARRAAVDQIVRLGRDFQNMTLVGVDLSGVDLRGADLRGADLSRSDLSRVDLSGAMLSGASFAEAQLAGADLRQTDLLRARYGGARCDARTMLSSPMRCASGSLSDSPVVAPPPEPNAATSSARAASSTSPPPTLEGGALPR